MIIDKSEPKNENIVRLTEIVFDKCGVGGDLVIEDWYIDKIYITKEGRKWMIRIWTIRKNSKGRVVINWTLYIMKPDGSRAAERNMGGGKTVMKNKKEE